MFFYYYHADSHTIVFGADERFTDVEGYQFLGQTSNPKPKMAAAAFAQQQLEQKDGYAIRQFDQEDV